MKNEKAYTDLPGLHRTSLTEEAAMTIRRAILSGKFTQGQQLTESRISEGFNISRAPVREALQQLMTQGLVVHHPNRGYFLKKFSARDIEEMSLLRAVIEKFAIQLAVERAVEHPQATAGLYERVVPEHIAVHPRNEMNQALR